MKLQGLFQKKLEVINIGLESFYHDMKDQNTPVVQLDWRPRAGGNKKVASLLDRLKK